MESEVLIFPLSFSQQRLWFLEQLEPGSAVRTISSAFHLSGPLNVKALEQSLNEVVRRHEVLRTTFSTVEEEPMQIIVPDLTLPLPIIDLAALPETERLPEARRLVREETQRPFDLIRGPLLRATLLRLNQGEHVLALAIHHIISDGWSMEILYRELSVLYAAFSQEKPSPLPDLPIQYADYAVWQRDWLQGTVREAEVAYWRRQLEGAPPLLELPTDRPRPATQTHQGASQILSLPSDLTQKLRALSQRKGVTLFMTLLAAFKVLLCRLSGQEDMVVGTPIAGRNRPEIEGVIGLFLNNLVLRTDLSGNPTFLELLHRVRETALGAYDHQDLPFEELLVELQPERDLSHTPLFQVFVNMHSVEALALPLSGLSIKPFRRERSMSHFDLTAYILRGGEDIYLRFVYRVDLFDQARMAEMMAQYRHLLKQVVADPEQRISQFSLVTPTAKATLPDPTQPLSGQWQGAIHAQFSRRARQMPERLAVIDMHEQWTYQELDRSSNQLANCLRAKGIESQDIVAIYGQRSAALIWAILGVLKAGAAFLILDPAYPAARLIEYLDQATPQGWIQIEAAGVLPDPLEAFVATSFGGSRIVLPERSKAAAAGFLADYSTEDPSVPAGPDDLAYVAFTSGSAGKPKGVLGRHGPLTHFLPWQQEAFALSPSDRFSMLSGLSHDPLQRDIFTALWVGATICVPDNDTIGTPGRLADWMAQQSITFAHITPAMGQILTETTTPGCHLSALRYAFFVGDKLTSDDVEGLRRLAPQATFINSYGSTETQRAVSYHLIGPGPQEQAAQTVYPLGWGMPDVQLLVLSNEQRLAGVGELGEIHIRSPHLARAYLGDEALTQARFLTNPFTGLEDDRLYKTGDLGRYLPDGMVEIVGRSDDQVKIRGFRIEPAEIEAVLRRDGGMQEAFVLAREDVPGEKQLVAYVVPGERGSPEASELRATLRARLPEHMVPAAFVTLDRLPLTPNGKVDVRALPPIDWTRAQVEQAFVPPRTPVEEKLASIWRKVLRLEEVGVRDDFFDLGGHSLLATRLIARVRDAFQLDLYLAAIFEAPTIASLAELVETMRWAAGGAAHTTESNAGEREEGEV